MSACAIFRVVRGERRPRRKAGERLENGRYSASLLPVNRARTSFGTTCSDRSETFRPHRFLHSRPCGNALHEGTYVRIP
jgi:hypothetical protein